MKEFPRFKKGEAEEHYNKLPSKEQKILKKYIEYRQAKGLTSENKLKDTRRQIIQFSITTNNFKDFSLDKLRTLTAMINTSKMSEFNRNDLKVNLKSYLKFRFKDWSARFNNLEEVKQKVVTFNEEKINSKTIPKHEEVEKLIKHENKMYWKAFFLVQYEAGFRTGEVRKLKWKDIDFQPDEDGVYEIEVFSTKTKRGDTAYIKEAMFYLKKHKEQQEYLEKLGIYVFPSPRDSNKPIDRNAPPQHLEGLSKRVIGRKITPYMLRHARATKLYTLAEENKISESTASKFMRHDKSMKKTYLHLDKEKVKQMLKKQVYNLEELPPEERTELRKQIEELAKKFKEFQNANSELQELLNPQEAKHLKNKQIIIRGEK